MSEPPPYAVHSPDELADHLAEQHAAWFADNPKGELLQSCLVVPEEGEAIIVGCPWANTAERDAVLMLLRALMIQARAVRYAVWSEVWMVLNPVPKGMTEEQAAEEWRKEYEPGDLAKDPDRIEAIFTLVVDGSGRLACRVQKIVRGRRGGVRCLEPVEGQGYEHLGGALANLMPARTNH